MSHALASKVNSLLNNPAVVIVARNYDEDICVVQDARNSKVICYIYREFDELFDEYVWTVRRPIGFKGMASERNLADCKTAIEESKGFPTEAEHRNYSRAVYKETSY